MPSLAQLEKLLTVDPNDTFVLYALAQEHAKANTPAGHIKAIEFYDRCLAVDPKYFYAYFHKAKSLEALERNADAIATLRAGLAGAKQVGDGKAAGEIAGYLDMLEP